MAQIKLLKIDTDGIPLEMNTAADEITLASYTVGTGGQVLSASGLAMNNTDITAVQDISFNDPTSGTINQTAGNLVINNIMAKERSNTMTTAADILFPVVTDSAGQLDAFRLPAIAGIPTAAPTATGEGFEVWDSSNDNLYVWNGSAWKNMSVATSAANLDEAYTADGSLSARDVVYISGADTVKKAKGDAAATSYAVGFAMSGVSTAGPVTVRVAGIVTGFSTLTPGARQYLSAGTAGAVTEVLPVGTGNVIQLCGYAKNDSSIQIQMQNLGKRA